MRPRRARWDAATERADRERLRLLQDIEAERQRQALARTAAFVDAHLASAQAIQAAGALEAKYRLLDLSLNLVSVDGLTLEFGVASGDTLRRIAARRTPVHGFDSFEGLPERWRTGFDKGAFAQQVPEIEGAQIHIGWFQDTLPSFLAAHPGPICYLHLDADLYSSTDTVFRLAEERLVPGSVVLFDEYFNYPTWEQHEHRAFCESVARTGLRFEYVAYNALHEQVLVRFTD